ncbi:hypothetical protein [Thermodesulfovibrio yellowstonii]|uniref:Tetratricopeptide repeat protein n=1 Tax=Thermodesulfovibrio yellowstonii TaxID=28262 RepID=A0A9W6LKY5_9BACT|nr:hypothetical protein [Thermodesulfovibrio islandicus]GLI54122.1 hypothetical protein TISLANDTSLP1_18150 [Thermodesulfovibrio islandicus]
MGKNREFYDKRDHSKAIAKYYDLLDRYNGTNAKSIKNQLTRLIRKDPYFLDSYLLLYEVLRDEEAFEEAEKVLDEAYKKALEMITDKNGKWPNVLEWGWLENRHIIRTILNKAISLWESNQIDDALNLFRNLLRTNPNDNIGARYYILAITMKISLSEFEKRFDRGGFYDNELPQWFEKNYKKFPDEFGWWEKAIKYE